MKILTYSFKLGDFQCHVIQENTIPHKAGDLIVNADLEQLERVASESNINLEEIPVDFNCLLVNTGEKNVLIDAGFRNGNVTAGLESLGMSPEDIDVLIITHTDYDHIGGILTDDEQPVFPRASYFLLESSWDLWSTPEKRKELTALHHWPEEKTQFIWETYSKIVDRTAFVASEEEFIPGFRLIPATGHRYDHSVVKIASSGEKLLHLADAVAHPLIMANHSWASTYDSVPEQAAATKGELLDWSVRESALIFGSHFPLPGIGTVQPSDGGWRWLPREG